MPEIENPRSSSSTQIFVTRSIPFVRSAAAMGNSPSAAPPEVVVHPDDSHLNLAARRVARIQDTLVQLDKAIEATYPAQAS